MELTTVRRLPGITFRHEVPTPPDALPRMDIAGFVGLASCGPVNVPVPVEDAGRFRELFGPDLPLAWDVAAGRTARAFLGPAVDAFFRNGGRRCWVVRVARAAATSRFPLPSLLDAATGRPALVHARCAGSWADALRAGPVLQARTVPAAEARPIESLMDDLGPDRVAHYRAQDGPYVLTVSADERVRPGDVLRISLTADPEGVHVVVPVRAVRAEAGRRWVALGDGTTFRRYPAATTAPGTVLPVQARFLAGDGTVGAPVASAALAFDGENYRLCYDASQGPDPAPGEVVHVTVGEGSLPVGSFPEGSFPEGSFPEGSFPEGSFPEEGEPEHTAWLAVGDVERTSHSIDGSRIVVQAADALWPRAATLVAGPALLADFMGKATTVERLAFELVVWEGGQVQARLGDLGLARGTAADGSPDRLASRFWAGLPADEGLFQLEDGRPVAPTAVLAREASSPRFPLAGPADHAALYVPLAMPAAPDRDAARPPLETDPASVLERDGLDGFVPTWLLDEELAEAGLGALPASVFDKHYVRREPLDAAHALWPLDEVTLVAAPDAVQPGWYRRTPPLPLPLHPPRRPSKKQLDVPGAFRLDWGPYPVGSLPDAGGVPPHGEVDWTFELEEATDPLFEGATVRYRGGDTHTHVYFGAGERCGEDLGCVGPHYYRVRARACGRLSPWSETLQLDPAPTGFEACHRPPDAPRLSLLYTPASADDRRTDRLEITSDAATRYVLEAAAEGTFAEPTRLAKLPVAAPSLPDSTGLETMTYTLDPLPDRTTYYRARAEVDTGADDAGTTTKTSPWSGTVRVEPPSPERWVMRTPDDYDDDGAEDDLRAFQHAVLRLAAARGDLVALLTLPAHYRTEAAAAYAASLVPEPTGVARSFGALYHPWVGVRDESGREQLVRHLPPDGAVTGLVAARARERGAWVAPANVALRDVVALAPTFGEAGWARLLTRGLNLVRPTPRGFALLSAETLATGELRPLNVRRLLILLRRLALREGHAFAFQSNSAALRRRVALRFEGFMTRLFERGAFAGGRPDAAFQVRTDGAVNPPESVDRGHLIVELRVAPSQPLTFLTVRLVQRDGAGLTVVEA